MCYTNRTQERTAVEAAEMAYNNARKMAQGSPYWAELMQLGRAAEVTSHTESKLLEAIVALVLLEDSAEKVSAAWAEQGAHVCAYPCSSRADGFEVP